MKNLLTVLVIGMMMFEMAEATVINFSDLSSTGNGFSNLGNTVTHDGFTFSSTSDKLGALLEFGRIAVKIIQPTVIRALR